MAVRRERRGDLLAYSSDLPHQRAAPATRTWARPRILRFESFALVKPPLRNARIAQYRCVRELARTLRETLSHRVVPAAVRREGARSAIESEFRRVEQCESSFSAKDGSAVRTPTEIKDPQLDDVCSRSRAEELSAVALTDPCDDLLVTRSLIQMSEWIRSTLVGVKWTTFQVFCRLNGVVVHYRS